MSGNRLTVVGDQLVVEPVGLDTLWSFTRRIQIPLAHVTGVYFDPTVTNEPKGFRFPGLGLPHKVAGTFYTKGARRFWNTVGRQGAVVIELAAAERFDRLILTVEDPFGEVDAINRARQQSAGTSARHHISRVR